MEHLLSFKVEASSRHSGVDSRTVPSQFVKALGEFPDVIRIDSLSLVEFSGTGSILVNPENLDRVRETIANSFAEIGAQTTFFR